MPSLASLKPLLKSIAGHGAAGAANATFWDYALNPDHGSGHWDPVRKGNTVANFLLGAVGYRGLRGKFRDVTPSTGLGALIAAPSKDLIINANRAIPRFNDSVRDMADSVAALTDKLNMQTANQPMSAFPAWGKWLGLAGAGAIGVGALGLGAYALNKRDRSDGKIMVTLPTQKPGDNETTVELPIGALNLSRSSMGNIGRDVRRRLRSGAKGRTKHRDPTSGELLTDEEYENLYGMKRASTVPAGVKSPSGVSTPTPQTMGQVARTPAMGSMVQPTRLGPLNLPNLSIESQSLEAPEVDPTIQAKMDADASTAQATEQRAVQAEQREQASAEQESVRTMKMDLQKQQLEVAKTLDSSKHLVRSAQRVSGKLDSLTKLSGTDSSYWDQVLKGDPNFYGDTLGAIGKPLDWMASNVRGSFLQPGTALGKNIGEAAGHLSTGNLSGAAMSAGSGLMNTGELAIGALSQFGAGKAVGVLGAAGTSLARKGVGVAAGRLSDTLYDRSNPAATQAPRTLNAEDRKRWDNSPIKAQPYNAAKWSDLTPEQMQMQSMGNLATQVGGMFVPTLGGMNRPDMSAYQQQGQGPSFKSIYSNMRI